MGLSTVKKKMLLQITHKKYITIVPEVIFEVQFFCVIMAVSFYSKSMFPTGTELGGPAKVIHGPVSLPYVCGIL